MNNKNCQVCIYCRVAFYDPEKIKIQKEKLEKFCKENKFRISNFYLDNGFSGLNFNRPSFKKLLSDIEKGKINLIVTEDLSRIGRCFKQISYYTKVYFPKNNVKLITIGKFLNAKGNHHAKR